MLLVIIHGPATGDEILSQFAVLAESNCTATDFLAANDTVSMCCRRSRMRGFPAVPTYQHSISPQQTHALV